MHVHVLPQFLVLRVCVSRRVSRWRETTLLSQNSGCFLRNLDVHGTDVEHLSCIASAAGTPKADCEVLSSVEARGRVETCCFPIMYSASTHDTVCLVGSHVRSDRIAGHLKVISSSLLAGMHASNFQRLLPQGPKRGPQQWLRYDLAPCYQSQLTSHLVSPLGSDRALVENCRFAAERADSRHYGSLPHGRQHSGAAQQRR